MELSPWDRFEQSALCGLCPECNISGSGNVPSAHGADGTASGCVISPAVIYLDFFYIDILGRMDTLDSVWKALDRGTVRFITGSSVGNSYFCLYSPDVLVLTHPIAHTNLCEDILGLGGILFQLPADVRHVDPEDLVIIVHIGTPDGIHDIAVGQDSAGIFR